jgi:hypothetical protein
MRNNYAHPIAVPTNKEYWDESMRRWANRNANRSNGVILTSSGPGGTTFNQNSSLNKKPLFNYRMHDVYAAGVDTASVIASQGGYDCAFWNTSSGYLPGEIVRVRTNYTETIDSIEMEVVEGTYVCVAYVPPKFSNDIVTELQNAGSPTGSYRQTKICYYPLADEQEPYINATYFATAAGTDIKEKQGRYWERLGGGGTYIPMTVCVGNETKTYYVNAYESGSI